MAMGVKLSEEEIIYKLKLVNFILIDQYNDKIGNRRIVIKDLEGFFYDAALYSGVLEGRIPPIVGKHNKFTLYNIDLWLDKNDKSFRLSKDNVYKNSGKDKLSFFCYDCKNSFLIRWDCIYSQGQGCLQCATIPKEGERLSDVFPQLLNEWNYSKNKKYPHEYSYGSVEVVWWKCSVCSNEWKTKISKRTCDKTGCKKCHAKRGESVIANSLKSYLKFNYKAISEYKIFKNPDTNYYLPYDIYIPHGEISKINGVYIEIHGEQHYKYTPFWHKTKEGFAHRKSLDKLKRNFAKKNGVYVEIDLRKIKTIENAIEHVENIIRKNIT